MAILLAFLTFSLPDFFPPIAKALFSKPKKWVLKKNKGLGKNGRALATKMRKKVQDENFPGNCAFDENTLTVGIFKKNKRAGGYFIESACCAVPSYT